MTDAQLTIDKGEQVTVLAGSENERSVFVWLDDKNLLHVAVTYGRNPDAVQIEAGPSEVLKVRAPRHDGTVEEQR